MLLVLATTFSLLHVHLYASEGLERNVVTHSLQTDSAVVRDSQEGDSTVTIEEKRGIPADSIMAKTDGFPVLFEEKPLFYINGELGQFNAEERARGISNKLYLISRFEDFNRKFFRMECEDLYCNLLYKDIVITTVTREDGNLLSTSYGSLAADYLERLKTQVKPVKESGWLSVLKRVGVILLALIVLILMIKYVNRGLNWVIDRVLKKYRHRVPDVKVKGYRFFTRYKVEKIIRLGLRLGKLFVLVSLAYLFSLLLFSFFPATENLANNLIDYVFSPLQRFGQAFLDYIPELITVVIVVLLARYVNSILFYLSKEIERERLVIPGFYPEWALPTFRLTSLLVYLFAFVLIFPYLPGSDSPAFQGVSVFLGLLISLGSTSAISNIIAGLVIIYMRAFKLGDRVRIGETTGDVIEKTMLITRLRTIKNEEVTIPNMAILNGSTVNYSASSKELGLILNTTVTIGYDVPWRKVHELLIGAALQTDLIRKEPSPFVLQTSLDDFFVSYQINLYTEHADKSAGIYSELHGHIQDAFNEAGIEIMSPHYRATRDGNPSTVIKDNRGG